MRGFEDKTSRLIEPPRVPLGHVAYASAPGDGARAFDLWHEVCRPAFEVEPRAKLPSFKAAYEFYEVSGLVFNHTRYSAANYHRTSRHVRGGESDFFVLQLFLQGRERGDCGGRPLLMAFDRIVLRDWAQPFDSTAEETEQLGIIIPRDRIALRDQFYRREPVASWDLASPQGRILASSVMSLWRTLPQATGEDAPALASGFLGLLNGLLSPTPEPAGIRALNRATLAAMQAFIEDRLAYADLGVDDLMRAFHLSRPTLYRMFQELGGVRAYIQERRLLKSFRELSSVGKGSRPIWQVASQCGFGDPAYFHRAFKNRFGLTAGEAAAQFGSGKGARPLPGAAPASNQGIAAFHDWLGI